MPKKGSGTPKRKKIGLAALNRMFPDNDAAYKWFENRLWPDGPYCPHCGSFNVQAGIKHSSMTHRCRDCDGRPMFSLKTGTIMEGSKLDYWTWAIAIFYVTTNIKGIASTKLSSELEITQKSAWHLGHRLRKSMEEGVELFTGPVEVDETYVGGKRKNMSLAKRKELKGTGRGAVGKAAVVGLKDRETKQVVARHVQKTDSPHLAGFVAEKTKLGSKVYSDEAKAYKVLDPWFDHEAVNHGVGEYVRDMAHTNGMESFWSMLKRGYEGIYHYMSPKHLDRYVNEFSKRNNVRKADTINQMDSVARGMVGKHLSYRDLTADNGLSSGARS